MSKAAILKKALLNQSFDPNVLESRATAKQDEVLRDVWSRHKYVIAGNQCLAAGTLVTTTKGIKRIEDIQIGDYVFDEHGKPIKVIDTFSNGIKPVHTLTHRRMPLVKATSNHVFLTQNSRTKKTEELAVKDFKQDTQIKRQEIQGTHDWVKIKISDTVELVETYDIHVDSDTNLYCLANGLVTHNSGKSSLKARDIAWKFLETHPYWERPNSKRCMNKLCGSTDFETITDPEQPKAPPLYSCNHCQAQWMDWRKERLSLLVGSKTSQLTEELWDKKIEPYLEGYNYKVERQSTSIKKVVNIDENSLGYGNEILFFSHDNSKQAKGRVQSLTLHDVWLDELPDSIDLIEELHRRVDAKRAQFCATFTPKTPNPEIRRLIDEGDERIVGTYRFGMLDNPAYANRKQEQLDALKGFTKKKQDNILYGEWLDGDEKVFTFSMEKNTIPRLDDYDATWPHVIAVDPAANVTGFAVACWHPTRMQWFVINSGYVKADKELDDPTTIVAKIEQKIAGVNIIRRIYDPHETWWMMTARNHAGVSYIPVLKDKRKKILVQNLITAIGQRSFLFVGDQQECYDELHRADWHPDKDFIIRGSQNLHIIDSLQYLWDLLPKDMQGVGDVLTRDQYIVKLWQEEKQMKQQVSNAAPHRKHRYQKKLKAFQRRSRGI